jgi:DNA polymerase-3 subunit gamma/tau
MSYLVLARKYRPQGFDDLVGQEHVAKTLANALEAKRLAHAYVFSGPRGCGKTTSTRILAKALNCVKGPTPTPCHECPQCLEIAAGSSTDDVLEIDGASNRGIEQIRELRDTVKYAPARSRYRVIIIDEAHQISKDGFNALLKTLEEPPPHVVFMMATTEAQKIPETILSRCQRFQLRSITLADIFTRLKKITDAEKLPIQEAALREVARAARGSLRDALSLLDQLIAYAPGGASPEDVRNLLGLLPGEFLRGFAAALQGGTPAEVLQAVQKAVEDGVDLSQLAEDLLERRHRLLLWKSGVRDPQDPDGAERERESALFSQERLERDLAVLSRAVSEMRRSESPRITFELACLDISQDAVPVAELLERLEALEKLIPPPATFSAGADKTVPTPMASPDTRHASGAPSAASPANSLPPTGEGKTDPPSRHNENRPPDSPAVAAAGETTWTDERLRTPWREMLEEVGKKKPSLETFLAAARVSAMPGRTIQVIFGQEFQRSQAAAHEALWTDILRRLLGGAISLRLAVAAAPPAAPKPPPAARLTAAPDPSDEADAEDEAVEAVLEEPAVDGDDEDPASVAALDPGVKRVLEKFPGKIRRVSPGGK